MAQTFVAITVASSIPFFRFGFELGAFDNVAYQWLFSVWVLATVTLVSSLILRDREYRLSRLEVTVLAVPSVILATDLILTEESALVSAALDAATLVALPYALYVLLRMLVGDVFSLSMRLRVSAALLLTGVAAVGFVAGKANDRVLTCKEFERVGEYQPDDCRL